MLSVLVNLVCHMVKSQFVFQGNSPQAKAVAGHLSEKLHELKAKIQEALVNQVAEDFIDITTPLKQLSDSAVVPLGQLFVVIVLLHSHVKCITFNLYALALSHTGSSRFSLGCVLWQDTQSPSLVLIKPRKNMNMLAFAVIL